MSHAKQKQWVSSFLFTVKHDTYKISQERIFRNILNLAHFSLDKVDCIGMRRISSTGPRFKD